MFQVVSLKECDNVTDLPMAEREISMPPPLLILATGLQCSRASIFCVEDDDETIEEHVVSSSLCRKAEVKPVDHISINSQ